MADAIDRIIKLQEKQSDIKNILKQCTCMCPYVAEVKAIVK